uniref:BRCT domain-containing protein n=1 Tax=Biomphalaria glabrata TaxID=6526 RepID=A0A2C9LDR6_BIOGL
MALDLVDFLAALSILAKYLFNKVAIFFFDVEFQHYVMAAKALRKVFVSIKGIYYQADVKGETITWIVSHKRGHEPPQDVDLRIMQIFAEYYSVLLGHINIKLYSDNHLVYPPELSVPQLHIETENTEESLCSLAPIIKTTGEIMDEEEDDPEVDALNAISADDPEVVEKSKLEAKSVKKLKNLFKGLKFYLNREVPREDLTFVIRCGGGIVSWDKSLGAGATYQESDNKITHHIIDRPTLTNQRLDRTYIQPQWIFDCFNARTILPAKEYFPGVPCPPHLSPFVEEKEGDYIPEDKVKFLKRIKGEDLDEEEELEEESSEEDMDEDEENSSQQKVVPKRKRDEDEDAGETKKAKTMAVTEGAVEKVDKQRLLQQQNAEERRLGEMMIPKKHKRLYHKIMTSRKKQSQEVKKLQEKKDKLKKKKQQK